MKTIVLISPYWKESHRWMVSTVNLAALWNKLGYTVVVVCLHSKTCILQESKQLIVYGIKDFFIPDPFNFGISWSFHTKAYEIIKAHAPDHVVINKLLFWTSWSITYLRLKGIKPIVLTDALVGITWFPRTWYMKLIMGFGGWTMGALTMKLAKTLVLFHPQPASILKRIGVQHKTQVIPSGINTSAYTFSIPEHTHAQPIVITYIGRLESVKGVDDFVAVMEDLVQTYTNIHVQVVGPFYENHPLVLQSKHIITFTGLRHDIASILAQTDIFVLPSYSEGLSNALMEAMSSGCACIATNVGGNSYLLEDFVSGFLYTPGDKQALQDRIEALIANEDMRTKMATAARKRIDEEFAWTQVAKKYEALFAADLQTK